MEPTLFRSDSMATAMFKYYGNIISLKAIWEIFGNFLTELRYNLQYSLWNAHTEIYSSISIYYPLSLTRTNRIWGKEMNKQRSSVGSISLLQDSIEMEVSKRLVDTIATIPIRIR